MIERPEVFVAGPQRPPEQAVWSRFDRHTSQGCHSQRRVPVAAVPRIFHRRVDEQLDGAVGRVRSADHVFEEPTAAPVDGYRSEEAHRAIATLCDVVAALLRMGERLKIDEEPHHAHAASR